jgi:[acyl-carrier-protein] S-malonyltransferase
MTLTRHSRVRDGRLNAVVAEVAALGDVPRAALVFPGQGSQRPGMGEPWAHTPGWALVEEASRTTGRDVEDLLLRADADTLRQTDNAQLATCVIELVVLAELRRSGLDERQVAGCAGHSLGEYAALVAGGVLDAAAAIRLVAARGAAMQAAATLEPGSMRVVLGLDDARLAALVEEAREHGQAVWLANQNVEGQVVLSGAPASLDVVEQIALEAGATRCVHIAVGGAFHSPLMQPAVAPLELALGAADFADAVHPVVANVDAHEHRSAGEWSALLARQVVSPVLWNASLACLTGPLGAQVLVEIGPGKVLKGFARRAAPELEALSCAVPADIPKVLGALSTVAERTAA